MKIENGIFEFARQFGFSCQRGYKNDGRTVYILFVDCSPDDLGRDENPYEIEIAEFETVEKIGDGIIGTPAECELELRLAWVCPVSRFLGMINGTRCFSEIGDTAGLRQSYADFIRAIIGMREDVGFFTAEDLKLMRRRRGLTQCVLAEKLGVGTATIARWETGVSKPLPAFRKKILDFFFRRQS